MNRAKKKMFRQHYTDLRNQLIKTIINNYETSEVDVDGDDVDQIQGQTLTLISQQLGERDLLKLKKIDIALSKIDDGCFGICEYCGKTIAEKRLMVIPGVENCIKCAEEIEKETKQYASLI